MDISPLITNLLNPPVLFFFLGGLAVLLRSDLELPNPLPKTLSLYLLLAIGFKGGAELRLSGISPQTVVVLASAIGLACLIPVWSFFIMRRRFPVEDAAALAAAYGSVSAVTFITAGSFLRKLGLDYSGVMVAAMALMESPAIIVGVMLARWFGARRAEDESLAALLREGVLNGSVFLLLGSLAIGFAIDPKDAAALQPFTRDLFSGALCLFLLDMGIVAARRLGDLRRAGLALPALAAGLPCLNAAAGLVLARLLGLGVADTVMFTVLAASASYIAVPAAMRMAVPDANPAVYVTMALGLTFPFNIIIGLPLYYRAALLIAG